MTELFQCLIRHVASMHMLMDTWLASQEDDSRFPSFPHLAADNHLSFSME